MRTVLIMDTDTDTRTKLFMGLPVHYEERTVQSVGALLLAITEQEYDLIVLGPSFLAEEGVEIILNTIRKSKNTQTPIILGVRRKDTDAALETALEVFGYGVNDTFIIDPYDIRNVQKAMKLWVHRKIVSPADAWEAALFPEERKVLEDALDTKTLFQEEVRTVKTAAAALHAMFEAARTKTPLSYSSIVKGWQHLRLVSLSGDTMAVLRQLSRDDHEIYQHSLRVALYADCIAIKLGFGRGRRTLLWGASITHDIGRVWIPTEILRTEGPLNKKQRHLMQLHPAHSEAILGTTVPTPMRQAAAQHHERMDGSGYPNGIAGTDIPLLARIIAVADACDGLVSARPHRDPIPHTEAVKILSRPEHYDQNIVRILCEITRWEYPAAC